MFTRFFGFIFIFFNISLLSGWGSELADVLGTNKLPPDEVTSLTKPYHFSSSAVDLARPFAG